MIIGWATLAALAFIWFVISFLLPPVGMGLIAGHVMFFMMDAAINGRDAEWVWFNLAGIFVALAGVATAGG